MGGDNNNDAKRQRVDDASTQRSAFEEDMGRIRSAMNGTGSQPAPDGSRALQQQSTSHQQQQGPSGGSTATANSQQQTSRPPENSQRSTAYGSEDDDEEGGNWLKNFRPHHARVGSDYQVSNLPAPPRAETDAASTSCVSSGSGGG